MSLVNTILHSWVGHYEPHGKLSDADCVLGLSFGYRSHLQKITPGLSNQDLADFALKHFGPLPKILQFEIADAYREAGGTLENVSVIKKHRTKGKYLDTREVVEQAIAIMRAKGYKVAVLLAHPDHIGRVDAVCKRLGVQTVVASGLDGFIEFDLRSKQNWTRRLSFWRFYEPLSLVYYKLRGWV